MKMFSQNIVRVRIAPSPTGALHVGTARTALFNWLFAKKNNGVFIVRIEDTDKARSKKKYESSILEALEWLGLEWDEGPIRNHPRQFYRGNFGPYRQSERTEMYHKYAKRLFDDGKAFYCSHAKDELEKEKKEQFAKKEASRHVCDQRQSKLAPLTGEDGRGVIRFYNSGGTIKFNDLVRGEVHFDAELLGDFSIAKEFDEPLYNFAAVVDDYEMKISHVIRGDDHLSNTPKQILLQQALGFPIPLYAHLPMILGPDRSKLSKRHGATSVLEYRNQGYLPDALFNFLALLGWNPGGEKEVMPREEIIDKFSLESVQKSAAVFNSEKLDWMNGEYIRKMPVDKLTELCIPYFEKYYQLPVASYQLQKIVALEQPRMKKFSEMGESTEFFFKDQLEYGKDLLRWKNMSDNEVVDILEKLENTLSDIEEGDWSKEKLEKIIMPKAEEWGKRGEKIDRGKTLWPFRVALTGKKASPGPFEVAEILGKQKCLQRLAEAMET